MARKKWRQTKIINFAIWTKHIKEKLQHFSSVSCIETLSTVRNLFFPILFPYGFFKYIFQSYFFHINWFFFSIFSILFLLWSSIIQKYCFVNRAFLICVFFACLFIMVGLWCCCGFDVVLSRTSWWFKLFFLHYFYWTLTYFSLNFYTSSALSPNQNNMNDNAVLFII